MHLWCCFHHHGWHGLPPIGGGGWVGNTQAPQLPQQLKISALEHLVSATITMPASLITKLTNTCFGPKSYFWLFDFTFPCWSSSSMLSWEKFRRPSITKLRNVVHAVMTRILSNLSQKIHWNLPQKSLSNVQIVDQFRWCFNHVIPGWKEMLTGK